MTEQKHFTPTLEQNVSRVEDQADTDRDAIKARLRSRLAQAEAESSLGKILFNNFKAQWTWLGIEDGEPVELQQLEPKAPDEERGAALRARHRMNESEGEYRTANRYARVDSLRQALILLCHASEHHQHQGLYVLANRLKSAVADKAKTNAWLNFAKDTGTTEKDIAVRLAAMFDLDPRRQEDVKDISATAEERHHAIERAIDLYADLVEILGSERHLAFVSSGNGAQVHLRIEMPNTPEVTGTIRRLLLVLDQLYSSETQELDTAVFDAKRLFPACGTWKRKGANNVKSGRVHRPSLFLPGAPEPEVLSIEQVEALIATFEERLTSEQSAAVEKGVGKHTPGPQPHSIARQTSVRADGTSDLARANEMPINDVITKLGLDPEDIACPGCGATSGCDSLAAKGKNRVQCLHNTCGRRAWPPVDLVAKVAFNCDQIKGSKGIVPKVLEWFEQNLDLKRSKRQREQNAPDDPRLNADVAEEGDTQEKPTIQIGTDEMRVNDAAVLALSSDPDVYARGTTLVQVQRSRIRELPEAVLREHMASSAEWLLFNKTDQTFVPAHPPDWSVKAVFRRGLWSGMRDLAGVVTYPTLLTDGRVLTTPGYDAESKLLYLPDDDWTDMPESPTIDDARAAVRLLTEVVSQFPFEAPIDRAAWLSELLTVVGRHAIIGPFPMFVHTANLKGTGKGKLVQCVSIIATGCQVEEAALPTTEEEREKRMAGVSLSGRPLYLFDEVTEISGATLQMVATSRQFSGRVLGVTGDYRGPMDTVFALTGNNVTVGGDMNRRIVVSRLLTTEEKPWQRTGFDHESLLEYVMRERKGLLIAALTILRAYVLAGRPRQRVGAFGSYEAWTALIASALVWVDQPDVTATTNGMDVDPDALHLDALLTAWSAVFGAQPLLAGDLIEFAETGTRPGETPVIDMEDTSLPDEPPSHAATLPTARSTPIRDPRAVFVAALCDFCPPRPPAKLPASTTLGNRLKVAKSRVVGGRRLLSGFDAHRKQQLWRVESLVASGAGVAGGSAPEHPQATTQRNHVSAGSAGSAGIVSPTRERIQVPPRRQENERLIAEALDGLDSRTREDPQHPHAAEITVPKHAGSPRDGNKATPATPAADALVRDQARSASAPHTPPTAGTPNVSVTDSELAGMFDAFEGRPHDDRAEHEARVDEAEPTHKYPALKVPAYVADLLDCL